tara:strand:- start:6215 stop:7270 length:1056 start_codon:yes stop_codon:yes gene_type:complete
MPKIVQFHIAPGGTVTQIADNTSEALDIESTDANAEDYITIDTTEGSENMKFGVGASSDMMRFFANGVIDTSQADGYGIQAKTTATATAPVFNPSKNDPDTGIGRAGADALSLVAGGVEGIRIAKDDSLDVVYVGINGAADDVNNTLLQLNGDSDEAELAFKLSGGATTTMGYRGQSKFSIDANGGFQVRNHGGTQHLNISTTGVITAKAGGIQYRSGTGSDTDTTEPVYLADTNGTMIVDFSKGNFGDITLAANVTAVKFFNAPADGTVATVTAKITQDSSARTFDYSDSAVTVYSDGGSTAVTGEIKFAGGAHHVQSTGSGAVDLVSFTCIPSGSTFNIYAAVIGQAFA